VIELQNVAITVRGRTVLDRGTATLRSATVTHLAGANGSGKTTLIRAIAGIQRYSGSIRFDGADVARVRSQLYVCFDDAPVLPYLSGYENVRLLLGRSLSRSAIAAVAPAIADDRILGMRARRLSHGQRKRLHLVAALASGAQYLILDEALNGVDAPTALEVGEALRRRVPGATVLVTGHHEDTYGLLSNSGPLVGRRIDILNGGLIATDDLADEVTADDDTANEVSA
jgi:ABC-type multidrug transport system ATPase subunit